MKKIISILVLLFLTNCFGPTIATIGVFKITASDVLTAPGKVDKLMLKMQQYNKQDNKEDYENKKLQKNIKIN
jgi:hypothetical protein